MKTKEKELVIAPVAAPVGGDGAGDSAPRDVILRTAAELFARKGFANVSIRDICLKSGVSLPMVYYYYGNKQRLFEAVVEKNISLTDFMNGLEAAVGAELTPERQLAAYIRHYLKHFPEGVITIGYYLRESASMETASVKRLLSDFQLARKMLTQIIEAGAASGRFKVGNVKLATDCLTGAINGFLMRWLHFNELFEREAAAKFVYESFVNGIKARKEGAK